MYKACIGNNSFTVNFLNLAALLLHLSRGFSSLSHLIPLKLMDNLNCVGSKEDHKGVAIYIAMRGGRVEDFCSDRISQSTIGAFFFRST